MWNVQQQFTSLALRNKPSYVLGSLLQVAGIADVVRQQADVLLLCGETAVCEQPALAWQCTCRQVRCCLRLQVADIADVVRQQADALMLCGETAAGLFPDKCVGVLRAVATSIEEWCRCVVSGTLHSAVMCRCIDKALTALQLPSLAALCSSAARAVVGQVCGRAPRCGHQHRGVAEVRARPNSARCTLCAAQCSCVHAPDTAKRRAPEGSISGWALLVRAVLGQF